MALFKEHLIIIHWLDGETLNQKEKLPPQGQNSYLFKKLEPRFADPKFGFLHKITYGNTTNRRPSSSVFTEKGEDIGIFFKEIMVHKIESKNTAVACVPDHKGMEESELTRPRAGEAQKAQKARQGPQHCTG